MEERPFFVYWPQAQWRLLNLLPWALSDPATAVWGPCLTSVHRCTESGSLPRNQAFVLAAAWKLATAQDSPLCL